MRAPFRAAGLASLLVLLAGPARLPAARAGDPRDELLRLVPDDVALCLTVTDLRGRAAKLASAPWVRRLLESPLGRAVTGSPEWRQLDKADEALRRKLGAGLARLRDDVFGDAVVLAFRLDRPGQQNQALLLLRARDPALLARLAERVNKDQMASGELKELLPHDYRGVRYWCRKKADGEAFYFMSGPLLALAGREELLREVIDRRLAPAGGRQASGAAAGLRGTEGALAALWLNPRAFDAELKDKAAHSSGAEARLLETFRTYWRALDGVTVALAVTPEPRLRLALAGRPEALPPAARRLLRAAGRPSELWERFPAGAVLVAAGSSDAAAFDEIVGDFLTPEAREARRRALQSTLGAVLGLDVFTDVLPRLGPDSGYCLADTPGGTGFPHVLVALRVRGGPRRAPVDRAVGRALEFFATLGVVHYNSTHKEAVKLRALKQGDVEVRYLAGAADWPAGLEPAFALKAGYLVLASSPAAVRRFRDGPASPPPAPGGEVPLLRLSLRDLARLLEARREGLVTFLAERNGVPAEAARRGLDGLLGVLALADRLDLTQRTEPGRVTWTLRLRVNRKEP
jgi:hypothetical protein